MNLSGAILVHGHRGARAVRPENTLPAFRYAIEQGADYLELDMAVTRDNVLVVSHDPHLKPPVCTGPAGENAIHKLTLAQVREFDCGATQNPAFPKQQTVPGTKIPTLDEVFDLAKGTNIRFNIETKIDTKTPDLAPPPAEFAKLVVDAIARHHLASRVVVQSFDFRTLVEIRKLAPSIRLSALIGGNETRSFAEISRAAANSEAVSPHYSLVTPERVREAHAAHLEIIPWTANAAEQWRALADAKVDAIISDDPAALIAWLKAEKLR